MDPDADTGSEGSSVGPISTLLWFPWDERECGFLGDTVEDAVGAIDECLEDGHPVFLPGGPYIGDGKDVQADLDYVLNVVRLLFTRGLIQCFLGQFGRARATLQSTTALMDIVANGGTEICPFQEKIDPDIAACAQMDTQILILLTEIMDFFECMHDTVLAQVGDDCCSDEPEEVFADFIQLCRVFDSDKENKVPNPDWRQDPLAVKRRMYSLRERTIKLIMDIDDNCSEETVVLLSFLFSVTQFFSRLSCTPLFVRETHTPTVLEGEGVDLWKSEASKCLQLIDSFPPSSYASIMRLTLGGVVAYILYADIHFSYDRDVYSPQLHSTRLATAQVARQLFPKDNETMGRWYGLAQVCLSMPTEIPKA
nr:hypothetical protein [Sicyoidochytrium minutum DNA virus]